MAVHPSAAVPIMRPHLPQKEPEEAAVRPGPQDKDSISKRGGPPGDRRGAGERRGSRRLSTTHGPSAKAGSMRLGELTSAFAEKPVTTDPVRCTYKLWQHLWIVVPPPVPHRAALDILVQMWSNKRPAFQADR